VIMIVVTLALTPEDHGFIVYQEGRRGEWGWRLDIALMEELPAFFFAFDIGFFLFMCHSLYVFVVNNVSNFVLHGAFQVWNFNRADVNLIGWIITAPITGAYPVTMYILFTLKSNFRTF